MTQMQTKFKQTEIGLIPEDWDVVEYGDICDSISKKFNFTENKVIFLNTGDIENGKIINTNLFDPEKLPGQAKKSIQRNDILFSEIRPINRRFALVNFDSKNYVVSTKLMVLRSKNIDNLFFYKYLTSDLNLINFQTLAESRSGTFPQITFDTIKNKKLPLPPLPEQKVIAEILSSFDDKIELLEKQNKTLENIGQALFKSWFVDFEGFENDLVESEMGMIPRGWKVGKVGDFADLDRGISYRSENLQEDGIPMINLGSFNLSGGIKNAGTKFYKGNYKENHIINNGEIIIASTDITQNRAILGKAFILPSDFSQPTVGSLDTLIFRNKSNISNYFFYYLMNTSDYRGFVESYATGTSIIRISKNAILDYVFVVPSLDILEDFDLQIKFIYKKIENNNLQIQTLSNLRDSLLPRLMSGKIRVV